ncbi:MAG: CAP domain-containing protein [Pyrinomonadaceae bacterium]|nr:CAP domain-containing protein [Pyrinomonadaceae bacterium]
MIQHLNFAISTLLSLVSLGVIKSSPAFLTVLTLCYAVSAQNPGPLLSARLLSEPASRLSDPPRAVSAAEVVSPATVAASLLSPAIGDATVIERRAFEVTNQEREKVGLAPLTWDADLCRMARLHSESMARLGFFGHETPEGLRLKERAKSMGILHFRVIAENIAYNKGHEDPGAFAVERWMISAGHRANILYVGFQASAIGSYVSTDGSVYLTQVFINR